MAKYSKAKQEERIKKIKRKYGADAFKKWGNQPDSGSPILKAYRTGKPVRGYRVTKSK